MLPVFGIIVIAGLCFAAGFWLGGNQQKPVVDGTNKAELAQARSQLQKSEAASEVLQAKIDELEEQVALWKKRAGAGAHTKVGELQFYKELPEQSVTPAPVPDSKPAPARPMAKSLEVDAPAAAGHDTTPASEESISYRVQIASFKTRDEAATMQLKLVKLGFTGFIRSVDLPNRGLWYRVYAGPYPDKERAKAVIRDIQDKMKIRGLLIRNG